MSRTVGEVLRDQSAHPIGRDRELALLGRVLEADGPLVVFLYGIAGIGKSTLVDAFAARARDADVAVLELDCRHVEPTERGFLKALGDAAGGEVRSVEEAADRIGTIGETVLITLDTYEVLRILDPWMRRTFVPRLPATARVVVSGREPPMSGWPTAFGEAFMSLPLGNLAPGDAREVLRRAGADPATSVRVNRIARGHPLSLKLAATALPASSDVTPDASTVKAIVEELTELYLGGLDAPTREVLDAASVVRRPTRSLLGAMLPDVEPQDALARLRALPFVELSDQGLVLHDTVREAVAASLRSEDPDRSRAYRSAAWRQLRDEVRRAPTSEMWRYTADLLFMIENPIVREAFFPSGEHQFAVEPSTQADAADILAIADRHEPPGAALVLREWWERSPTTFKVVRDRLGGVAGFLAYGTPEDVDQALTRSDPLLSRWLTDVTRNPVPRGQRVLLLRRALMRDHGETLCPEMAAAWLDIKRVYMEMRPHLRRVYTALREVEPVWATLNPLGFEALQGGPTEIDGTPYHSAVLDFGPSSVDGWLTRVVAAELMVEEEESLLDPGQRQVVVDGRRVDLTPLEFEFMTYLHERRGRVVRRTAILDDVWGYRGNYGGSNVIEAVVRSLRRKLGAAAGMIETVRGTGYRLNVPPGQDPR